MKRILLLVFLTFSGYNFYAQDIIYMSSGDEIQAKVSRVSSDEISYYRSDHLDGPEYTIYTSGVFMIKFSNGSTEMINELTGMQGQAADSLGLCEQAKKDAWTTYKPTGSMIGTYVSSLVIMPAGLITAIIVSRTPPSEKDMVIAHENYQDGDDYVICYFNEAKKVKKKKVWMSFWSGWATGMAIVSLILLL